MTTSLEPRVAKVEAGLDILTKDVQALSTSMREMSQSLGDKIEGLSVSVTKAQAPRGTDWNVVIAAIFLILAIGSAAFWPLNMVGNNNREALQHLEQKFEAHQNLTMHPVGMARVDALEKLTDERQVTYLAQHAALDTKIQRETQLMTDLLAARLADLDLRLQKEFSLRDELSNTRLDRMELWKKDQQSLDQEELRAWRLKAMGGPEIKK